jgi:hypothetical protein
MREAEYPTPVVLLPFFPFELKYVMEGRTREALLAFRVFYVLFRRGFLPTEGLTKRACK